MKQKSSLDIAKFFCAILVLLIHVNPFSGYSKLLAVGVRNILCVIAVPFFFCASGYLLTEKLNSLQTKEEQNRYIGKYLKRLAVIYLFWSAVYFPFVVVDWIRQGFHWGLVGAYLWDFVSEGSFSTIWFLPALMVAAALYFWLRSKCGSKKVFFIGCGIYVITLLLSSYYGVIARVPGLSHYVGQLYYSVFDTVKNGVLFGLVFVALGGVLSDTRWAEHISRKKSVLAMACCYVFLVAEVALYTVLGKVKGVDTVASLLPLTAFALAFVLSFQMAPSALCITLRKYSMLIFLCQRLPITVLDMFLGDTFLATNSVVKLAVVATVTWLIGFCIIKLSEKFKWIKQIY